MGRPAGRMGWFAGDGDSRPRSCEGPTVAATYVCYSLAHPPTDRQVVAFVSGHSGRFLVTGWDEGGCIETKTTTETR